MNAVKILSEIGHGEHGATYKALYDGEVVVLKSIWLRGEYDSVEDINEIEALIKILPICVPYAVCILDAFLNKDFLYIITDYIDGYPLLDINHNDFSNKPLRELVKGLNAIHQVGVAHGDIHGNNVMYDKEFDMYRYIDFGLGTPNPTPADYEQDIKRLADLIEFYYLEVPTIKSLRFSDQAPKNVYIDRETIKDFTKLMKMDFNEAVKIVDRVNVN